MSTTRDTAPSDGRAAGPGFARSRAACDTDTSDACVPQMRHFVQHCVRRLGLPETVCDTASLVVSELVANAVLHSGSRSVTVLVQVRPGCLIVEVRDRGRWQERSEPRHSVADGDVPFGRGLDLVRAVSAFCTVDSGPRGTAVVAGVRVDSVPSAPEGGAR